MSQTSKLSPEREVFEVSQIFAPIVLRPILVERIWGAKSLEPWHTGGSAEKPIGEIWLTAETCVVASGEHKGKTLAQLTEASPELFGDPKHEGFPLLIKLLFPREKLSVQVHPDDAQAQAKGMPRGKTECWYIVDAEPGAEVAVGFQEPITTDHVRAAIADGSLESRLRMIPVQIGDMVSVDAGTVHAIGPGMVVLETQQYSDTTYRLWDYGRPRELHVDEGMAVTRTDSAAGLVPPVETKEYTRLVSSPYFIVDRYTLGGVENRRLDETDRLQILVALADDCRIVIDGDHMVDLPRAQAVILPATHRWYALHSSGVAEIIRILQPKP